MEKGFGFYPERERDREIIRGAIHDVAEHFGLTTVEELDHALTVVYGKDHDGDTMKLADIPPPSRR